MFIYQLFKIWGKITEKEIQITMTYIYFEVKVWVILIHNRKLLCLYMEYSSRFKAKQLDHEKSSRHVAKSLRHKK